MTSKLDTAGRVERNHDPKLVEALKTIKTKLEALPEALRGPFLVEGLAPYSLNQAATPDMEPFGYWCECKWADPALLRKPAYIPPTDALHTTTPLYSAAQLSALQERAERAEARVEQLENSEEWQRLTMALEAAEARVAEIEAALRPFAALSVFFDATGASKIGGADMGLALRRARAALAHKGEER